MINYLCIKRNTLSFVLALLFLLSFSGCAGKNDGIKDPAFEKWRVMAENSKGYSPSARSNAVGLKDGTNKKKVIKEDTSAVGQDTLAKKKPVEKISVESKNKESLPKIKITLKMNNVELPTLLRALARAVNLNILINDKVKGEVNINVKDANWDQLFNGILHTHGLTYSWEGDLIRIMTLSDLNLDVKIMDAKQKKSAKRKEYNLKMLSMDVQAEMSEPLVTRVLHVDYTDAEKLKNNLMSLLKSGWMGSDFTIGDKGGAKSSSKFRGTILVDPHTNSLMIQAVNSDIDRLIPIIRKLDRPTHQILIKAQIVETSSQIARQLGIQWQYNNSNTTGGDKWNASGSRESTGLNLGYMVDRIGGSLLDIQLSALQEDGKANILSNPSITTLDNMKAIIESGKEVPYQTRDSDGKTKVQYKKAVIRLEVTPHVIAGKELKLEIKTNKTELDKSITVDGNPGFKTREAETTVVLLDGQTTVIGGLSIENSDDTESGVPLLKDIPIMGYLFKERSKTGTMDELLIFITPYILDKKDVSKEKFSSGIIKPGTEAVEMIESETQP